MKTKVLKKELILAALWIVVTIMILLFGRGVFYSVNQDDYNDASVNLYEVDLYDKVITQGVSLSDDIEQISLLMVSASEKEEVVKVEISNATDDTVLDATEICLVPSGGEEQVVEWKLETAIDYPEEVVLNISSTVDAEQKIYVCVQEKDYEQVYTENSVEQDAHLRMAVVYSQGYNLVFMAILLVMLLIAGFLFIFEFEKCIKIENLYLIAALIAGVSFVFITPFGQEADGWVHFARSMDVSYGNLFAPFWDNNGNGSIFRLPENAYGISFGIVQPGSGLGSVLSNNMKDFYFSNTLSEFEVVGGFASIFYLPQAIGLFIARILGLSAYGHMILGRLGNLLAYVGLSYYGLKKMPIYRNIYMVVALLPMTLYQAASFSYDALLYGLCFVFIALCLNYAYEKEQLGWFDVLKLGIILALLLTCKYVYACIGLLVFMIPMKKFSSNKEYWKSFVVALVPVVFMVIYVMPLLFAVSGNTDASLPATETTQVTQLSYVLSNPFVLVKVFIRTILGCFEQYVRQLNILGWLNYSLGNLEMIVPIVMCCVAVLDVTDKNERVTFKNKIIEIGTFAIVVAVGMLGLYLIDYIANPVGAGIIAGYQGRYTIPVLMLFLAMFSSKNIENKINNFSSKVLGIMLMIIVYASITLLQICY